MTKPFFQVFPTLQLHGTLQAVFEQTEVAKITATKKKDFLRVYLISHKLIQKPQIWDVEKEIEGQLFQGKGVKVKFYEQYTLSDQYTPETFYAMYRDSILEELKAYDHVIHNMFRQAEVNFAGNQCTLKLKDMALTKSKTPELVRVLEKIFNERFQFSVAVEASYQPVEKQSRYREENEQKMKMMVARIQEKAQEMGNYQKDLEAQPSESREDSVAAGRSAIGPPEAGLEKAGQSAAGQKRAGGENVSDTAHAAKQQSQMDKGRQNFDGKKAFQGKGKSFGRGNFYKGARKDDNPDVIYGRDFDEDIIPIEDISGEMGEVVIHGKVLAFDMRPIRNERTILIFDISDFTDTITVKMFTRDEELEELGEIKKGAFLKIKGVTTIDKFDHELTIGSITGIKKGSDFTSDRMDNSVRKRVELHCHTKMSDMDGVTDAAALINRAKKWGMEALAITDHGCVQAFTEAAHALDKNDPFKVIYGVEGYLVDDLKEIVTNCKEQKLEEETYVVFDLETTGFSPVKNRIIEIGAVKVQGEEIIDRFSSFVNPLVPIPFEIEKLTSISDGQVMDAPLIEEVLPQFLEFVKDAVLVAHNAGFDMGFILENCKRQGIKTDFTYIDTVTMARVLLPNQGKHTLDAVAKTLHISLENHHRAVDDAEATAEIFIKFIPMLLQEKADTLRLVNALGAASIEAVRKLPYYHVIILAKNDIGRINLYKLISDSHLSYFNKKPKIPKSAILHHREGLIVGSACEAGELYRALLDDKSDAEIARIVSFYDYLEVQPVGNNMFMIESERVRNIHSIEDIQAINKRIVALGEQFNKPVAATCDVHFMDAEDEVYRRIIMAGKGFKDSDNQAPLYLRTTEEMLAEFEYMGSDKAEEIVVTNTNLIADMCEKISPVRPDKCAPVIENSDGILRTICYNKAKELYGGSLPKIVEDRLEKELKSIIGNGFAVMYIIAQKLVWKSVEDGYLVGSRGSVGSSFVAYLAGITEVNSLSAHYRCPKCFYTDFDSEEVKGYAGMSGCDMPDRMCPECGEPLVKDGFDIPFETFLGFKGNKEPDIDLNFSGEYQSKAHNYTKVIFGDKQTFRAGTIGTLADKTAFGYVKNYYEERGQRKRNCEINRIVQGCTGIRRTTGQHPGGIIVLPVGENIYSFTPVQHPANDMTTDIVTTHFDYHSIDHNLLKLDILGHDDPTMIRMLEDITGIDATRIPLDDKGVMSLFQNTKALGITPEQIGGCPLGSLGVPEFGTEFVIQMLLDAKPKCFSDLIRISGLGHGTDVWLGNAQTLIEEGKATISTAICTRDDIMIYLIGMGMESELSFTIMEAVRKGKGLRPEWEEAMREHNVPDWYIWSCNKIKYMFPKAHAAAYVMMAWRIAYCKINYPLAYYAAFFSIRASAFSYEIMCQGQEHLEKVMAEYKKRQDTLSKKEQDTQRDMKIVQEMYARGFEFEPIDIYKVQSRLFQVLENGKIMPSLSSIDGLGEKAADAIVEAAKESPFLSKDDLRNRTKASKTVIDLMGSLHLLGDLPESNQMSLFDLMEA